MTVAVHAVVDLGFGDGGKGTLVDFLVRETGASTVVRWHGGAQAGHRVVDPSGRAHVFAQLGAGTLAGARTHLAEGFVLDPVALLVEAARLEALGVVDPLSQVTIAGEARVITPFARASNRLRELARGDAAHGTCGLGFGETVRLSLEAPELTITVRDLHRPAALAKKLRRLRDHVRDELRDVAVGHPRAARERAALEDDAIEAWLEAVAPLIRRDRIDDDALRAALRGTSPVVLEGAQGVLLDEWAGFHPHTTWSTATSDGAGALLDTHGHEGPRTRYGVLRTYATRHGQGPFPTETGALAHLDEPANGDVGWQGRFRRGWLDLVLLRYALSVSPVEALALTHLDELDASYRIATGYRAESPDPALVERRGGTIHTLRPSVEREDLDHQARLTALLAHVRPELAAAGDAETLMATLEGALGVPVAITSASPDATSKRWRRADRRSTPSAA